jgi:hypothetical protein
MKAIIQHNFTSGLGDCIVACTEYISTAQKLKSLGFSIDLKIYTENNLYYNNLNLFDILNEHNFINLFDNIDHISSTYKTINNFEISHLSYGAREAGLHWWDLFTDYPIDPSIIDTFPNVGHDFNNIPNFNLIDFSSEVYDIYNNLKLKNDYICLHVRTQDLNDEMYLYENNLDKINNLYDQYNTIFVCSNSFSIKKELLKLSKTISIQHPLEDSMGSHHCYRNKIPNDIAKQKTLLSAAEILAINYAKEIFLLTSWHRISNFLFYPIVNKTKVTSWL